MKKQNKVSQPTASKKSIRVLIVDDHSLIRRGMVAVLSEQNDLEVCGQTDSAGALEALKDSKPDVIVVDITMRGASGLDLIKQIAYDPRVKILALDLNAEGTYATRAIKNGAKGYLTDTPDEKLAPAIRRIHAGQLAVSDVVAQQMVASIMQTNSGEPMDALSDKELEVAEFMGKGLSTSQIGEALKISIKTVETHKAHMKTKLGIAKGSQLVRYCVQWYEQRNAKN